VQTLCGVDSALLGDVEPMICKTCGNGNVHPPSATSTMAVFDICADARAKAGYPRANLFCLPWWPHCVQGKGRGGKGGGRGGDGGQGGGGQQVTGVGGGGKKRARAR
jgi:hypothetical protein